MHLAWKAYRGYTAILRVEMVMCMSKEQMISVEEAQQIALSCARELGQERVTLYTSYNRVLARDVISDMDVSPFDNSAMDGFALRSSDIEKASDNTPVALTVVAEEAAGRNFDGTVEPGTTVRIMTGAPVPKGADCVVKFELVQGGAQVGDTAVFRAPCKPGSNIRQAGEEFREGDVVLRAHERITSFAMGMLASAGAVDLQVYKKPVVGVFSIGSELVSPEERPTPGMIRNSNTACLTGLIQDADCIARVYPLVPDDQEQIRSLLVQALDECDAVISAGGASTGDYDFINDIIGSLGEIKFNYISLRPGKRQTFGICSEKPVWGLSGNPAAAAVGFELLIRPVLRVMQGLEPGARPVVRARLSKNAKKKESRRFYERGHVERAEDGSWTARSLRDQSSALLGPLKRCNCLIILPDGNMGMKSGEEVECVRIDLAEGTPI